MPITRPRLEVSRFWVFCSIISVFEERYPEILKVGGLWLKIPNGLGPGGSYNDCLQWLVYMFCLLCQTKTGSDEMFIEHGIPKDRHDTSNMCQQIPMVYLWRPEGLVWHIQCEWHHSVTPPDTSPFIKWWAGWGSFNQRHEGLEVSVIWFHFYFIHPDMILLSPEFGTPKRYPFCWRNDLPLGMRWNPQSPTVGNGLVEDV